MRPALRCRIGAALVDRLRERRRVVDATADDEIALAIHRVDRVQKEVHEHLLEIVPFGIHHAVGGLKGAGYAKAAHDALIVEQPHDVVNDLINHDRLRREPSWPRVVEEATHDAVNSRDLALERIDRLRRPRHVGRPHAQHMRVVGDRRHGIADFVRDAGGDAAHGRQLLHAHARLRGGEHLLGHAVDAGGQLCKLVGLSHRCPAAVVAIGNRFCRLDALGQRDLEQFHDLPSQDARPHDRHQHHQQHDQRPPPVGWQELGEPHGQDDRRQRDAAGEHEHLFESLMDAGSRYIDHPRRMRTARACGNGWEAGRPTECGG